MFDVHCPVLSAVTALCAGYELWKWFCVGGAQYLYSCVCGIFKI